jgi:hypothetical protein
MAGLAILEHMHDLSDKNLCDRWLENPYYQYFCGAEFFCHKLLFDRSSPPAGASGWAKSGWWPCGTFASNGSPCGAQPRVRVMFVLAEVSSRKTSRSGANLPWYFFQNRRLWATSGRSCSAADSVFFEAEPSVVDHLPDRDLAGDNAAFAQFNRQGAHRQLLLLLKPAKNPSLMRRQRARLLAALRLGRRAARLS